MGIPARLTAQQGRKFAFTVGIAFAVLGALSAWRGHQLPPKILWALGGLFLAAGVIVPGKLSGVNRAWMGLATAISKVTAPIILSAVYFIVVTPTGFVMRLIGSNPLRHKERKGSFWMPAAADGRSDLETQF